MTFMIIVSSTLLALEHPLNEPNGHKERILSIVDEVFSGIFVLEACLKIISLGLIFNGEQSYLAVSWNILDFTILILSLISPLSLCCTLSLLFLSVLLFQIPPFFLFLYLSTFVLLSFMPSSSVSLYLPISLSFSSYLCLSFSLAHTSRMQEFKKAILIIGMAF